MVGFLYQLEKTGWQILEGVLHIYQIESPFPKKSNVKNPGLQVSAVANPGTVAGLLILSSALLLAAVAG